MEAPAPLKPPEITSPLKSEPQALIFPHSPSGADATITTKLTN